MSESTTVTGENSNQVSPKSAANQTEQVDPAWLMALPHFLGAFSIFTAYFGFLLPFFYWLAKKDEDEAIASECRKVLCFQGAFLIFSLVFSVGYQVAFAITKARPVLSAKALLAMQVVGHVSIVTSLLVFGFSVLAGYKVLQGHDSKYPHIGIDLISLFQKKN
jgi:uncharacterized Tic20 family protein